MNPNFFKWILGDVNVYNPMFLYQQEQSYWYKNIGL